MMPFAYYTGDDSKGYLASGMHDAVITELGQLSSVRVISKTSTLKYADFHNSIQEVATELNVDGVIETSLISPGEAMGQTRLAIDLDPLNPLLQSLFAMCLLCEGDCEAAMKVLDDILASDPENYMANNILEKAAFNCGDYEKAYKAAKYHIPLSEEIYEKIDKTFEEKGFIAAYEEILRQVEVKLLSDFIINPLTIAGKYHMIGQYDKALDWIEKGFELGDPGMPYIATGYQNMFNIFDNPRFIAVLKKMKLPAPVTK